jgi:hypothetical protein
MVTYLGIMANDDLKPSDTKPISDCLHWFESHLAHYKDTGTQDAPVGFSSDEKEAIRAKVEELIGIVEGLHQKFSAY